VNSARDNRARYITTNQNIWMQIAVITKPASTGLISSGTILGRDNKKFTGCTKFASTLLSGVMKAYELSGKNRTSNDIRNGGLNREGLKRPKRSFMLPPEKIQSEGETVAQALPAIRAFLSC
jgi:hypothetical protein